MSIINEKMTTFAEAYASSSNRTIDGIQRDEWVFNWFKALEKKIDDPSPSDSDEELYKRSSHWATCACGNMCDVIPRTSGGQPVDDELENLGTLFNRQVEDAIDKNVKGSEDPDFTGDRHSWRVARMIFERIEIRSFEILHKMGVITKAGVYTKRWLKKIEEQAAKTSKRTKE